jgi:hypothetical protein
MFLKPTQGTQVPDPDRGDFLPPEGRSVELTQYWQRRIIDGDVVEASPPTEATKASKGKE